MFDENHLKHPTPGTEHWLQLYQCSTRWRHTGIILALFFLSHLTRHNLLASFTWALTLSQKIAYHSSSRFPVIKYLAMSLINLFLDYASFPRGINDITKEHLCCEFQRHTGQPTLYLTWHISQLLFCCILGAHFATRSAPPSLPRLAICLASPPGSPSSGDSLGTKFHDTFGDTEVTDPGLIRSHPEGHIGNQPSPRPPHRRHSAAHFAASPLASAPLPGDRKSVV